tara:strand:- start:136 stop:429 length:294 start_codon:yes stop_codon:yes gene_type:complete
MKISEMSDYEKYLLIADSTWRISGGYQGFVNFKEVIGIIRTMFSKQSTTYEYNNNYYTSKITISEMGTILNSFDLGVYRKGFNLVRSVANQIGIGRI